MSLSFDTISTFNNNVVAANETRLAATINSMPANPTTGELLRMQTELAKWTMSTDIQSQITKTLGDALKGVIQKSG